jgi:hypothetical protein
MKRLVLSLSFTAATLLTVAEAHAADAVGIPACDDFLTKYEACITGKIPAAQQPMFKSSVDQMRAGWASAAKTPHAKPALESACKQSSEQAKVSTAAYGCVF